MKKNRILLAIVTLAIVGVVTVYAITTKTHSNLPEVEVLLPTVP